MPNDTPGEDDMENNWGCNLVYGSKEGGRTLQALDRAVKQQVPGYKLHTLEASGTQANLTAIHLLTNSEPRRALFAVGSYCGGDQLLQSLSSSAYTAKSQLSLPKDYDDASPDCKRQSVSLPYMIDNADMALSEWEDYETKCYEYLYRTLFVAQINGKPYKVLMLEYVLGGCGAELRPEFLERLAGLLKQFHIAVIADEVLTGARVGPTMTMTTSQPTAFKECVEVITMGKFLNCAIVLRKRPNKPIEVEEPIRGTSTHLDCSHACRIFISATNNQRLIPSRRRQVLHKFGFGGKADTELHWGRGLLVFTNVSRPQLTRGLKNRLLPMIENTKIRKSRCVTTTWNRSSVAKLVKKKVEDWLCMQEKDASSSLSTFQVSLVEYIFAKTRLVAMTEDSFVFHQDQVWEFIGLASATEKADVMRIALALKGVSTKKKPKAFLHAAILKAIANTKSTHGVFKKRVGNRRTEYVYVSAEYFLR